MCNQSRILMWNIWFPNQCYISCFEYDIDILYIRIFWASGDNNVRSSDVNDSTTIPSQCKFSLVVFNPVPVDEQNSLDTWKIFCIK